MTDEQITPPASEAAVIGAVILSGGEALDELSLTPHDFVVGAHMAIYEKLLELHGRGVVIDTFVLVDALDARYHHWVYEATNGVFTWHNVGFYADAVAEASLRRRIWIAGEQLQAMSGKTVAAELPDAARTLLDESIGIANDVPLLTMGEEFAQTMAKMAEVAQSYATPWPALDAKLDGGLRDGAFYVVGARPGMGKSAIALQLAQALANRGPVLFSSLEMGKQEVNLRVFAQHARIPFRHLLGNRMTPFMVDQLNAWRANNPLNIVIDDAPGVSVFDIRNRARSIHRRRPLGGVVVDYIQLMRDPRDIPRHEKVAEMTRNLKLLSRELGVPVIAASQLNRESVKRADSRPSLADLRESGSIEQDADVVLLLDREEDDPDLGMYVAKNRQGETGMVWLDWQGEFVRAMGKG